MMHRFSLVVPLEGDENIFEDTLASVLRHRPDRSQVIVVHDGSYRDPHHLTGEISLIENPGKPHLAGILNRALDVAGGDFLALIRPGVEIDENWHLPVEEAFEDPQVASVSPVIVSSSHPSSVVAAGVSANNLKHRQLVGAHSKLRRADRLQPDGPTSWFAIYRREVAGLLGEFDANLDSLYVDLDIALAFQTLGLRCELVTDVVATVENGSDILNEARRSHGYSAQRATQRFGGSYSRMATCLLEVSKSLMGPRWLRHWFQRWGAFSDLEKDELFHGELLSLKATLSAQRSKTSKAPYPTEVRRAA